MLYHHSINFYYSHEILGDFDLFDISKNIVIYLNKIVSQTTNRRFKLGKINKVKEPPYSGSAFELSFSKFDFHFYVGPWNTNTSLYKENGDAIILVHAQKYHLEEIYNEKENGFGKDLLFRITHEYGHTQGCAIGEYYNSAILVDLTQIEPKIKISALGVKYGKLDNYWSLPEKKEWLNDPMLIYNPEKPRFCWLSSQIINSGKYRLMGPSLGDLKSVKLKINPQNSLVSIYSCKDWTKIASGWPDNEGIFTFNWGADEYNARNRAEQIKIIKVYPQDKPPFARAINIWDLQELNLKYKENYYFEVWA